MPLTARLEEAETSDVPARFDAAAPLTVGIEEELMLLDPVSGELKPCAGEILARLSGDGRFKPELPASQLEIATTAHRDVPSAMAELAASRRAVAAAAEGLACPAAAGCHPFSHGSGTLNSAPRYEHTVGEYGAVARRQLVCALQVHVAVGSTESTIEVYNALREYLPLLAALAANAPFYEGRDTGLASVRPKLSELLPRQGVPPALPSLEALAEELRWGAAAGSVPDPGAWWWELRPHVRFGTLEVRVPDAQSTVDEASAVAAVIHSLVAFLSERGHRRGPVPDWRIAENRWSACRHGLDGLHADLHSGLRRPVRELLTELLDRLEPYAQRLGAATELDRARALTERNGAIRQRELAGKRGARGLARWLVGRYTEGL